MAETINIDGKDYNFVIKNPTEKDSVDADIYSSQTFAKLTRQRDEEGKPTYLLRAQLDEYLREIGIFTMEDMENLGQISKTINECEDKLFKGGISKAEGKKTALELRRNRFQFIMLLNKKAEYDKHTVEHHCENARFHFLITRCIRFANGEPVFKSVEDYETDEMIKPHLSELVNRLAGIVSTFDPDFDKNLPENKFLLKFGFCNEEFELVDDQNRRINSEGKLINDDGNLINEDGQLIDNEGNLILSDIGDFFDEEESPPKKKRRTSKPKTE